MKHKRIGKKEIKIEIKAYAVRIAAMAVASIPTIGLSGMLPASFVTADNTRISQNREDVPTEKKVLSQSGSFYQSIRSAATSYTQAFLEHMDSLRNGWEYVPSILDFNLAHLFPEEQNTGEMPQSLYQNIQRGLCLLNPSHHKNSIGGELYDELNEREQEWLYGIQRDLRTLPYRMGIELRFLNGDGQVVDNYSNTQDILAVANVYSYYHGWDSLEDVKAYTRKLWDLSHQFSISVGEVHYCDGCIEIENPGEEEDTLFFEMNATDKELSLQVPLSETTVSQEEVSVQESDVSQATDTKSSNTPGPASDLPDNDIKSDEPEAEDMSDISAEQELAVKTEGAENSCTESENGSDRNDAGAYEKCPGHVDVTICLTVTGLNENHNLFSLAETIPETEDGVKPLVFDEQPAEERNSWPGWDEYTRGAAKTLSEQDWNEQYGLAAKPLSFGRTLTRQEFDSYINLLPEELSTDRKNLISFALDSVGKIPYYYGGKASKPHYEGNQFFAPSKPDPKGRTLKGLDCSGWINWVYWSVLGSPVTNAGTSGLAASGKEVAKEELKPGDIAVASGNDAHVVMFLGWDKATGKMICIHESAGNIENVTVTYSDRKWTHYRSLLD